MKGSYVQNETLKVSRLSLHVLLSMQGQQLTKEDVRAVYLKFYPQGIIAKKLRIPPISLKRIERILLVLVARGFLLKEFTRFYAGDSCKIDTPIYSLSKKGAQRITKKK